MAKRDINRRTGKCKTNFGKYKREKLEYCFGRMDSDKKKIDKTNKPKSPENQERESIYSTIKEQLSQGKNKIEVLAILNNKFPNTKLSIYFSSYINYFATKLGIKLEDNKEEETER